MMLGKASAQTRSFILELFLIVAGILIALAIDEWREEIEEAKTAQVFLHQLTADLVATETQINSAASNTLLSEQTAQKVVDAFENGQFPEPEELSEWLARIRYVNNPVPVLGTAESLVSTGDLRVIPHVETRSGITSYLSRSKDFWLVPLYQLEDFHQNLYHNLLAVADEYGIVPGQRKGRISSAEPPDVIGFFASSRAYTLASKLSEIKQAMVTYRRGMLQDASELKESLAPFLESMDDSH